MHGYASSYSTADNTVPHTTQAGSCCPGASQLDPEAPTAFWAMVQLHHVSSGITGVAKLTMIGSTCKCFSLETQIMPRMFDRSVHQARSQVDFCKHA